MVVDGILGRTDALVEAWLPGTEGAGVADVLFGDYKPTGKLSFSWARATGQKRDPLFAYGYGLSY
jgi:beta-glucosidase